MTNRQKTALVWCGSLALLGVFVASIVLVATLFTVRKSVRNTSQHINRVLIVVGVAASRWEKASVDQSKYTTDMAQKSVEVLDAARHSLTVLDESSAQLKTLISNTDASLNHSTYGVLPLAAQAIIDTDYDLNDPHTGLLPSAQYNLNILTNKIGSLAESLTLLTNHADGIVVGQDTQESLIAMRESLQQLRGALADAQASAADIREKVHQATRPASFLYRIGQGLLTGAVKARQMYGY